MGARWLPRLSKALVSAAALLVDLSLVLAFATTLVILLTGGGALVLAGQRISLTGVDNPLLLLSVLSLCRYFVRSRPFFGRRGWSWARLQSRSWQLLSDLRHTVATMGDRQARRIVIAALLCSCVVKLTFAYLDPGFFSGDDLEVQEMSLRAVLHTHWTIWDLRSPFFPIGFVYPAQLLAHDMGLATTARSLVFSGRVPVALISSLAIWLVWRAGRRLWPIAPGWAAIAALFLATAQLHISFGSTELPRPVATVFVLGGYLLLQEPGASRIAFAGVLLGLASCFRFSEMTFVCAGAIVTFLLIGWRPALLLVITAVAAAALIIGVSDLWYWGEAFHSARSAVDYTVIHKLSSRGYQHGGWYFLHPTQWLSPAVGVLAIVGAWGTPKEPLYLWVLVPVVLLSVLPHKEARYLIPVMPFLALIAARGLERTLRFISDRQPAAESWLAPALIALLLVGLSQDMGHWRLPRSNADVAFATEADKRIPPAAGVTAEQAWRLGGPIYLGFREPVDLDPGRTTETDYLWGRTPQGSWLLLDARTAMHPHVADSLEAHGYSRDRLSVKGSRYTLWRPPSP
jgi:glycosyl transferase family 22 (putative mannosyltransferase)